MYVFYRHLDCVSVLLEHNARHAIVDVMGWSPRVHALYRGHMTIAKLLKQLSGKFYIYIYGCAGFCVVWEERDRLANDLE